MANLKDKSENDETTYFSLTQEFREPLRLCVVFHGHSTRVEEDHGDDEPEPPLLLAHLADRDPGTPDTHPKVTRSTYK